MFFLYRLDAIPDVVHFYATTHFKKDKSLRNMFRKTDGLVPMRQAFTPHEVWLEKARQVGNVKMKMDIRDVTDGICKLRKTYNYRK